MTKNTICRWYDKDAEAAAHFYAATFPDSAVSAVHRAPSDYPGGKKGAVISVEFTVAGVACLGLDGGPMFKHNEPFLFRSRPKIRWRPTSIGMRLLAMAVRPVNAAGAATNGACPGRSPLAS